jgi:CRP-like cAMP-binding protein
VSRSRDVHFESALFDLVGKLTFFESFADAQRWEIIQISNWQDVPESTVIFDEGQPGSSVYVIAKGDVIISRDGVTLNRLGPGDCFGELAYLDEERPVRSARVTARTPLVLIEIEVVALQQASESLQVAFNRALMKVMVRRIRHSDKRMLDVLRASTARLEGATEDSQEANR